MYLSGRERELKNGSVNAKYSVKEYVKKEKLLWTHQLKVHLSLDLYGSQFTRFLDQGRHKDFILIVLHYAIYKLKASLLNTLLTAT